MTDISGPGINPESLLDYCCRASDVGLTSSDEFHSLLAVLQGAALPAQESSDIEVRIDTFLYLTFFVSASVAYIELFSLEHYAALLLHHPQATSQVLSMDPYISNAKATA